MQQEQRSSDSEQDAKRNEQEGSAAPQVAGTVIAIWVFLIGAAILAYATHYYVGEHSESVKVFIASIFSLAVVIVVVIQAGIYYRQSQALDSQRQIMEDTLKETRRIFDLTERPIIVAMSAQVEGGIAANKPLRPVVVFANKGRTAAQRFRVTTEIAAKKSYFYVFGFGETHIHPQGDWFVAAGDPVAIEGAPCNDVTIDNELYDGVINGRESFMIHGKGTYEDLAGREYPIEYAFHFHAKHGFTHYPIRKWGESDANKKRKPN